MGRAIGHRPAIAHPLAMLGRLALIAGDHEEAAEVFRRYRDDAWIVNSRNTADEDVVRIVASLAGFEPRITQRADISPAVVQPAS